MARSETQTLLMHSVGQAGISNAAQRRTTLSPATHNASQRLHNANPISTTLHNASTTPTPFPQRFTTPHNA
jgi:hypothetical protein